MLKKITLTLFIIVLIGILLPVIFQQFNPLHSEVADNYRSAYEPFGKLLLAAKQIDSTQNYTANCGPLHKQVLVKTYSWMMIPGPTLAACLVSDEQGSIIGIKNFGVVEKR